MNLRPQRPARIRVRAVHLAVAVALGAASLVLIAGGSSSAGATVAGSSAVTKSVTAERDYLDNGVKTVVDPAHTVTMTVDQTANLKSLQLIHVSWSGARPTAGLAADPNSAAADQEEYPFVLMECRGIDSTSVPAAQQLSPQTCFTSYTSERFVGDGASNLDNSFNEDGIAYPAWRSDEYAAPADRAQYVNRIPTNLRTKTCADTINTSTYGAEYWVPYKDSDGQTYYNGPLGLCGIDPDQNPGVSSTQLPANETYGVTAKDGTGTANFDVFSGDDHPSLGCSTTVPCALVAVPIEGISCDASGSLSDGNDVPDSDDLAGAVSNCEVGNQFTVGGALPPGKTGHEAVSGVLWWSASNWRNRITVPLSFATSDKACAISKQTTANVYGSELMTQASLQWAPHFCLNPKLFNFTEVQTPEPQARTALAGGGEVSAVFGSQPTQQSYPMSTVNAPVAVTGFAIAYDIDNGDGNELGSLNLDARLLAKLLTESYSEGVLASSYPVTKNADGSTTVTLPDNPTDLYNDPEFKALNPGFVAPAGGYAPSQPATLLSLDSSSDVLYALTSYINADPEARAWLDGQPDPWGMRVNPNYEGISLPLNTWPTLDTWEPHPEFAANPCLATNPTPWLPLIASPQSRLSYIAQDMEFTLAQSQTVCSATGTDGITGSKLVAVGRQPAGIHFMLGLVTLGDAERDGLNVASLETQTSTPWQPSWGQFTTPAGRTFVAPSTASLLSAAKMLTQDPTDKTWPVPYSQLRTAAAGAKAYPGTMVVYATVPTSGLTDSEAADYGELLSFAAGPGQTPGTSSGDLPPGFLPMTAANGLGALASFTAAAATQVSDQNHQGTPANSPTSTTSSGSKSGASPTGGSGVSPAEASSPAAASSTPATSPSSTSSSSPSSSPSSLATKPAAEITNSYHSGLAGLALPGLAVIALVAAGGAVFLRLRTGSRT